MTGTDWRLALLSAAALAFFIAVIVPVPRPDARPHVLHAHRLRFVAAGLLLFVLEVTLALAGVI